MAKSFFHNKVAVISVGIILIIALMAVFAPFLTPYEAERFGCFPFCLTFLARRGQYPDALRVLAMLSFISIVHFIPYMCFYSIAREISFFK